MVRNIVKRKPIHRKQPQELLAKRKTRLYRLKFIKFMQFLTLAALVGFGIWHFWFDKENIVTEFINDKSKKLLIDAGFAIRKIEINGNEKVSNDEILAAMLQDELENLGEYPIVMLSLEHVKRNLSSVGWIEDIKIKKKLPGTVIINIAEREAVAIWQNNKEIWLTDKNGTLISKNVKNYITLPIIVGKDNKKDVKEVFDILSFDESLNKQVKSFTRIGDRRWNVRLDNNILVKLPETEPEKAWKALIQFQKKDQILSKQIDYIDLRIEGQIVTGLAEQNSP